MRPSASTSGPAELPALSWRVSTRASCAARVHRHRHGDLADAYARPAFEASAASWKRPAR